VSTTRGVVPSSKVSGSVAPDRYFRFEEHCTFDPEGVIDVLRGKYLGIIYRNAIDSTASNSLLQAFWRNPATKRRTDAPSYFLGTYHFDKSAETYLTETAAVTSSVESLTHMEGSPWVWFRDIVGDRLRGEGAELRTAEMNGMKACPALIRSWDAEGAFALYPHEDMSQCSDPRQTGFEIQRVTKYDVCAVNMCLANGAGGRLVIWNVRPDDATRERLGVKYTGFSYPPSELTGFKELYLSVRAGDIYVFNGAYVHAVEANQGVRANLSFFMGILDEGTVVTWT
jgi:hypothetical protein